MSVDDRDLIGELELEVESLRHERRDLLLLLDGVRAEVESWKRRQLHAMATEIEAVVRR